MPVPYEVRPILDAEAESFLRSVYRAFGADYPRDTEEVLERFHGVVGPDRVLAAFDGSKVVGTLANLPLTLRVPGGTVGMAGTTMVTVQGSHRRLGVQRALMTTHLGDARRSGMPVAGLWSSEVPIYGRYGYGNAQDRYEVKLDASITDLAGDGLVGRIRFIDSHEAAAELPGIYDAATVDRPGSLERDGAWWKWEILHDPEDRRHGMSTYRFAVREGSDGADGYVIYRQKENWEGFVARGSVAVEELVAASPEAHRDLWSFVTNIDLYPQVSYWNLPLDDELPWRVVDSRRLARRVWDGLWIRILDVSRALEARSYPVDGTIRFGVVDEMFPDISGSYELVVTEGSARCRPSEREADLRFGIDVLGAAYLGGRRLATLDRAGLVEGPASEVSRFDELFSWPILPWCPEIF